MNILSNIFGCENPICKLINKYGTYSLENIEKILFSEDMKK